MKVMSLVFAIALAVVAVGFPVITGNAGAAGAVIQGKVSVEGNPAAVGPFWIMIAPETTQTLTALEALTVSVKTEANGSFRKDVDPGTYLVAPLIAAADLKDRAPFSDSVRMSTDRGVVEIPAIKVTVRSGESRTIAITRRAYPEPPPGFQYAHADSAEPDPIDEAVGGAQTAAGSGGRKIDAIRDAGLVIVGVSVVLLTALATRQRRMKA